MTNQTEKGTNLPEVTDVKTREVSLMGGIIPKDFSELTRFANLVHQSRLAPKGFDTVEKVAIGLLTNMELGRPIITGLQDLAIINGRCGIYGDASLAMVTASGKMDEGYPKSTETGTPFTDDWTFTFTVKRIGRSEETGVWTWIDAKRAGFDDPKTKDGRKDIWSPWTRFTRRMMQWKARNFVMRDNFGDILKGMKTVEDLHDLDPIPMSKQSDGSFSTESGSASDLAEKIKEKAEQPIAETPRNPEQADETQKHLKAALADKIKENETEHHQLWSQNQQKQTEADKAGNVVDAEFKAELPPEDKVTDPGDEQDPLPDAKKQGEKADQSEILCPYCKAKIKEVIATYIKVGGTSFACPVCHKQGYIENGLPISIDSVDKPGNHDDLKAATKKQDDLMTHGIDSALTKIFGELTNSSDAGMFWRMREKGLDLFFDAFEGKMKTWPKEIQDFVMAKCKNIAGKHPEFVERFEKAITVVTDFPALDGDIPKADDDENWNGLYYDCPNMDGKPIPRVACQNCDQREGCPTPFIPKQAKQEEMKF